MTTEILHRLATQLDVPVDTLLRAAHTHVRAVLNGEASPPTWRELLDRPESEEDTTAKPADPAAAERIAGYDAAALAHLCQDIDGDPADAMLVGEAELRFQVDELCGPEVPLPDLRMHQLFEQRAVAHPDRIAAEHDGITLTYLELDQRANRIGRTLLRHGLHREDVIAVVTERNLYWMASVLAVFKAGGTYLPIEPHFPPERIAAMLTRAECTLVLTETGSTDTLDRALAGLTDVRTIDLATLGEDLPTDRLDVDVAPDQLAYIYFTSGSTGEPKGAMCEHAGMLNHLYAKVLDLELGEGAVVAQTAPQCFDISMWQLVAALLVGGRTVLVEQDVILDVDRFLDTVDTARVEVLQVVPSYLDVVLTRLQQRPRPLAHLRCVSVTGEALPRELVRRWFAAMPGVALVNAYGLTETSDDTNHEVMHTDPEGDRVPLGAPVANVWVYVVDERLRPVPLGAPGEIVFSGVCVGRGYINDPARTQEAFFDDPVRPGQRLYRSGDYGRWRPDGKLEFLGRRDAQVKVAGFRIEIGDVEHALGRLPGVREATVVVARNGGTRLVGFYAGDGSLDEGDLVTRLEETLPVYLVPAVLRRVEEMPLTANGKVDRGRLSALAEQSQRADVSTGHRSVALTPAELRVAAAWAAVLDVPVSDLRSDDNFRSRGGTSLGAVKVVVAFDRDVTLREVADHPVLADLARLLDSRREESPMRAIAAATVDLTETAEGLPVLDVRADDAAAWVGRHPYAIRDAVEMAGAVLVTGLGLRDHAGVAEVFAAVGGEPMVEREAFAARTEHRPRLYSSSTWPATQPMCHHHELSYADPTPGLVLFACLTPADTGGTITLADAVAVLSALPADLVARFEREGWLLTRTYSDEIGASWTDAFGTDDRAVVDDYCSSHGIEATWLEDGGLRTRQRRAAIVRHPRSGQPCWFNQVAFLSEWTLDPDVRDFLVEEYGPDGLPFTTAYGNGDPIPDDVVRTINGVYEAAARPVAWQAGDLLVVDNLRTAHGRDPYTGTREVLVGLAEPVARQTGGAS